MQNILAQLIFLVLPAGATTGRRIVINGVTGEISAYDDNDNEVTQFDTFGFHVYDSTQFETITIGPDDFDGPYVAVQDAIHNQVKIFVDTVFDRPVIQFTAYNTDDLGLVGHMLARANGVGAATYVELELEGPGTGTDTHLWVRGSSSDATQRQEVAVDAPVVADGEVWTNLPLTAPWVVDMQPQYRLYPDGDVALRGRAKDGSTVVGTVVATLPAGYRVPAAYAGMRFVCGRGDATAQYGEVQLQANGTIVVAAPPTLASLDFSGIRFSTLST